MCVRVVGVGEEGADGDTPDMMACAANITDLSPEEHTCARRQAMVRPSETEHNVSGAVTTPLNPEPPNPEAQKLLAAAYMRMDV